LSIASSDSARRHWLIDPVIAEILGWEERREGWGQKTSAADPRPRAR
jgi:hypothetical protein